MQYRGLVSLTQTQLDTWVNQAKSQVWSGRLPDYIPLLAKADPNWVAVQVSQNDGTLQQAGDVYLSFALMSVIKPLLLLFLLEHVGYQAVFSSVGMDPSDQPFHSISQLRVDRGFPRNPMINSGAIALASRLPGNNGAARSEALRQWLNQQSGSHLVMDEPMLASVRSLSNATNRAIAESLVASGIIDGIETTLDTYNHICCLSATVEDLAKLGVMLAGGVGKIAAKHLQAVNALMLTCGLYEASGRYAVRIGLPIKSGVSGAMLAVVPGQGAIACYSPAIDGAGNSIAGLLILEQMANHLKLSLFG